MKEKFLHITDREDYMTYHEFKKDPRLEFFNKKVLFRTREKTYYLFSKCLDLYKNEENLKNCYLYILNNKKDLLLK